MWVKLTGSLIFWGLSFAKKRNAPLEMEQKIRYNDGE